MDDWRSRIKKRMEELGLTERQLCLRAGVSTSMFQDIYKKGTVPSVDRLFRIASALGMSLTELYEGTEQVRFVLRVNAITTAGSMWGELPAKHAKVLPIEAFSQDTVAVEISDDSYSPRFDRGDVVAGPKTLGGSLGNLLGRDCIVMLADGERRIGILLSGTKDKYYTLRSLNPRQSDLANVAVAWAAPIRIILRGQS